MHDDDEVSVPYDMLGSRFVTPLFAAVTGWTTQIVSSADVVHVDSVALASLPLPFSSRTFANPLYIASNVTGFASHDYTDSCNAFHVYDAGLAAPILGQDPQIKLMVYEPGYAFANEAPVYFPDEQSVYFCSDAGGTLGRSNISFNNVVFRVNLTSVLAKLDNGTSTSFKMDVETVAIDSGGVQMTNGATNYQDSLLLINSGRGAEYPPTLALVDRETATAKVMLNNAAGKHFNALNDVVVHPKSGAIFFTDAWYGQTQGFRPYVDLPLAVWRFEPESGLLTALTDPSIIAVPNGLAFSPDGTKLYVTDTGPIYNGTVQPTPSRAASIYQFDVQTDAATGFQRVGAKSVFAWPETGVADGIKTDTAGNVYVGTADGVSVYTPMGQPIFKAFMPQSGAVNLVFAEHGRLIVTAQERLFIIQLNSSITGPPIWDYPL